MNGTEDRRNPYLVLGLPYGSSPREATRTFARRSREVNEGRFTGYTVEDLTWALNQVEQAAQDTGVDVRIYRVPANPSLFDGLPDGDTGGSGFFNPSPVPIGRATDPVGPGEIEALLDEAVTAWVEELLGPGGQPVQIPYPFPE